MDSETASEEADQPGWYRLLPAAVLVLGLLVTALLWMETRQALIVALDNSAAPLHDLQAQRLDDQLTQHEQLLQLIAEFPIDGAGDLLDRTAGWQGLLRVASDDNGGLEVLNAHLAPQAPEGLTRVTLEQPFWEQVRERGVTGSVVATPNFRVVNSLVQGLVVPTSSDTGTEYLISLLEPETLIAGNLTLGRKPQLQISVKDLQQHETDPIYSNRSGREHGPVQETTLSLGDRQWLVRSRSAATLDGSHGGALLTGLLIGGVALTIALTLLAWQLVRYLHLGIRRMVRMDRLRDRDRRALENNRVEKDVMTRALSDSEQRTRDFIQLGGGIGFELDDEQAIGYVSAQVQPLLGRAPSDLAGLPLTDLLPGTEHQRLTDAVHSSKRERTITRLDTDLLHQDGSTLPVRIQICSVCDALSQCQGFRAVAWPHRPH